MTIDSSLRFCLGLLVLIAISCSKPALIGSDFLEDEKARLQYREDFPLTLYTTKTDSVVVHSDNVSKQLVTYLCGQVQDPVFGAYSAEIFTQPLLPGIATALIGSTFDSVVLQLRYDTLGTYGSISEPVTLEVYQMEENPLFNEDYYSNHPFASSTEVLGSVTFIPHPLDSVTVYRPTDTTRVAAHVRIPLDVTKMSELLLQDTVVFTNQDSFLNYFKGLHIKMTSGNNTMLGFNLLNSVSGLSYYYDKGTSTDLEYKLVMTSGSVKTVYMQHDYTGSPVSSALGPEPELDYSYVQGLSGVATYMTVEGLDLLQNAIINQAELELYATFPEGDVEALYPPCRYLITQEKTDTSIVNSEDVAIALAITGSSSTTESFNKIFGGKVGTRDPGPPVVYKYTMNVTNQIKDIYAGNQGNVIYFNPFGKGNTPNRAVIFGSNHPTFAPRLKITYTVI